MERQQHDPENEAEARRPQNEADSPRQQDCEGAKVLQSLTASAQRFAHLSVNAGSAAAGRLKGVAVASDGARRCAPGVYAG